ncbi:MAG: hypothetical protein AAB316_00980, partial [Bacteroidota bacterium]
EVLFENDKATQPDVLNSCVLGKTMAAFFGILVLGKNDLLRLPENLVPWFCGIRAEKSVF